MAKVFIHESAIVEKGARIGRGTKIWHFTHIMEMAKIGENCGLGQNVFVGNNVVMGNNVKVQNNVSLYEGVVCENEVFIGPSAVFTNIVNPRSFIERKKEFKSTIVKKGATVGANATIICGVILGEYCFISAGAVVTKDVKPYALIVGVPGSQQGWVSRAGITLDDNLVCPLTGEKYILENGYLKLV